MRKSKDQIANEKTFAYVKERLTEKGYRDFLAKAVSCTSEHFRNGGKLNWMDFERKAI